MRQKPSNVIQLVILVMYKQVMTVDGSSCRQDVAAYIDSTSDL